MYMYMLCKYFVEVWHIKIVMASLMATKVFVLLLKCALVIVTCTARDTVQPCDSPVYCYGDLLEDVQVTFSLFEDSKQFVDMPMKDDPSTILTAYENITDNITREILEEFVTKWFDPPGSDLLRWEPPDWTQSPRFINYISDNRYREWASDLNTLWRSFGKKLSESVALHPSRHSLLPVMNPFIAAGGDGRFLEYYYWDSFWITRGLLLCEMYNTTKGMISNLANLIDKYGFVPNGGRIYYTERSQPPLLSWMVSSYYTFTNDVSFVKEMLPLLDKEYQFWMNNRTLFLPDCNCSVNYYASPVTAPRPESYREDVMTASQLTLEESRSTLYSNLASAAESGWDFSSRWLSSTGPMAGQLASIRTQSIIPVDLNAILGANEILLRRLHVVNGSMIAANRYADAWNRRKRLLDTIFWSEKDHLYKDLLLRDNKSHYFSSFFYSSSIVPLYTFSLTSEGMNTSRARIVFNQLQSLGVLGYPGGLPTSLNDSGQQWDFPNVWAPLQWLLVKGLEGVEDEELRGMGRSLALSWLSSVYQSWTKYNHSMFEKYNCTVFGEPGGGGEYILQSGFGWTNGVVLDFLSTYNSSTSAPRRSSPFLWFLFLIPVLTIVIVTLLCVCCCRRIYIRGKEQFWARIREQELLNSSGNSNNSDIGSPQSPTIYSNQDAINSDESDIITYRLSDV